MNIKECCNKYVTENIIKEVTALQKEYNESPTYANFIRLVSNCPQGIELFMRCTTNYLCLRNIYAQRKNHKLKEDYGAFCDFIRSLPYAEDFLLND